MWVYIQLRATQMTNKHVTRARAYEHDGVINEQNREYEQAISFYQMAQSRWRQVRQLDRVNWCRCRIGQCQSMMLAGIPNE